MPYGKISSEHTKPIEENFTRDSTMLTDVFSSTSGHSSTTGWASSGSSPAIAGSSVHQQYESGVLVLVSGSGGGALQVGVGEIYSDGEKVSLGRGVTGKGATRDSSPYHSTSTRSSSSINSG